MSDTKQLTFIVNGTETQVYVSPIATFEEVATSAWVQTGNIGRPVSDFQLFIDEKYTPMKVSVSETPSGTLVFMSLKAGIGA